MTDLSAVQECLYCDSAENPDCLFSPSTVTTTRKCAFGCVSSLYSRKTNNKVKDFARTCFEDIEPDSRDSCTAENNCIKCEGEKCNTAILPAEERLSCWHCNGSNCDIPISKKCVGYSPNEMCYIYFDNTTLSAVRMGCRSDVTDEQLRNEIQQYFICDGDNCNDYNTIPEPIFCTVCDSEDDVYCATDPTKVQTQKRCGKLPFTQCYTRIRDGVFTQRGCLSDLSTDNFISCNDGLPNSKCKVCTDNNCNTRVYPSSRRRCLRCSSLTDNSCEDAPNVGQACPLYKEDDACITQWLNGTTKRACASEMNCKGLGLKNCRECYGHFCNTINLANEDVGYLGVFTNLPLQCHKCNGTQECSNNTTFVEACSGNIYQSCTTIFNRTGAVLARGCSDDLESTCLLSGNKCFNCKSNSCNAVNNQSEYIECLHCDSRDSENCVFNVTAIKRTRKCPGICMTALYPRTNGKNPVYELTRSCLDDKDLKDQATCEASKDPKCKSCRGEKCNSDLLGSRKSCYQCTGDDCKSPKSKTCRAVTKNDQCFMQYDASGALVELGCRSKYDSFEVESLIKQKSLWLCDEDNCNSIDKVPLMQDCITCSSTSEINCAIQPSMISASKSCGIAPYTQCYQRINGTVTERGCAYDLTGESFLNCLNGKDKTCQLCDGKNCNGDIFPTNRKRCHRCSSQTDSACETNPSRLTVCPAYDENDICAAVFENGITKRGCQTDFTCDYRSKSCHLCSRDGCNSDNVKRRFDDMYGIFQDLPLNCYTCKGEDCQPGKPRNPNVCEGDAYQDCMTVFDNNGKVIQRGCEFKVLAEQQLHCNSNPDLCFKCKANGCNNMTDLSAVQECLYCDSAENPDCLFSPSTVTTTRKCAFGCVSSLYSRRTSKKVKDFVRTCFEDIEPDNRESCTAENNCLKCEDRKCNTAILPTQKRLACLHCNGSDCVMPSSKSCVGYDPNDMCYMYFDNVTLSAVRMGCRSDVSDDDLRKDIKQYFVCDGDNCNDYDNLPEPLICLSCDSEDDVNCAINTTAITKRARCGIFPYTQCYTRIRDGVFTERGCLSSLSTENFINCHDGHPNSKCSVCTENYCNRIYYPSSRKLCYRCNSTVDPNCEANPNVKQVCPLYKEDDACVTQWVNGTTIRACASELTCDGLDYKHCRKCAKDKCNTINLAKEDIGSLGLFTKLPLQCHQCNGTDECTNATNSLEICNNMYEACATAFDSAGNVTARGCFSTLNNICSVEDNKCFECKSNNCNVAINKNEYINCVHCDAQHSEECVFNVTLVNHTRKCYKSCMTALYPRTNESDPSYELIRGCLDDKDLSDRISCESAEDPKCTSCKTENCNINDLGSRRSCYQCKGDGCQSAESQTCRAVANKDQCFIEYDERGVIIEMGCRSKYNPSEVANLVKQKRLWLCDTDNCNSINNTPKPQTCVICSSRTNQNCATKPDAVNTATTCENLPYTQCYSRVLKGGHTERGCLSNLEDDELLDCFFNKNSTKCLACIGDKCNQEIFPAGRRSCQRCNTKDDPACESSPNFASVCPLFSQDQYCATKYVNGHTYRGCSSEFQCDESDKQYCRLCHGSDNCNTINLAVSFVGDPGRWQELPLRCHICNGKECSSGNSTLEKCTGNNLQTCMTVFEAGGAVAQRGCSDAVMLSSSEYCEKNEDKCFACKSNACNNAESLEDYVDCYFCDSSESSNCAIDFNPSKSRKRKCQKACMATLYHKSSENVAYELSRTCLDDLDSDDREKCLKGNKEFCLACEGALCNTMNIPEERFECYKCIDDDCEDMEPRQCTLYHPNEQCYVLYNNESSVVSMGCHSEFEPNVVTELVKQKQMFLCKEKRCNAPENLPTPKLCSVCNSADNPQCATNPNLVNNITRCSALPFTQCFTRVNDNGHTERGCLAALEEIDFFGCISGYDKLCETCVGDKCNEIDVYPANRTSCQQCDSTTDINCASAPNYNKVCELYKKNDYCLTNYINGITTRGCGSSIECTNENDPLSCRSCEGNNCNDINMKTVLENGVPGRWQDIPISCYSCKGEEECSAKGDFRPCLNDHFRSCMTVFNATSGKVVQRGCSDLVERGNRLYCQENKNMCLYCNSNGCNEATSLQQYVECTYCDTESNGKCMLNSTEIGSTRQCYKYCMTALFPRFKEDNPSYALSRSCYDDMDYDDRKLCADGKKEHCKVCSTPKCNVNAVPEKRHSCYICEGDGCNNPKTQTCSTYRPDDKCYMRFDERNQIVALGCHSQFSHDEAKLLTKQKLLLTCNGENCNTVNNIPDAQTCVLCNSRTNKNCAINVTAVKSETQCGTKPFTQCYSRVLSDGATERGCLSNLYDDEFLGCLNGTSTTCKACKGNNCNSEIFPVDRLKCHVCDSTVDPNCEAKPNSLSICSIFDPEDTCVTSFRNNVTHRGCSSTLTCDKASPLACRECSGEGCNTINLANKQDTNFGMWQDLPLTCLSCSGNDCDSESTTKSLVCQIYNEQDCMTVFDNNGKVIARGCSDSLENEFCSADNSNCYRCKSNKCNKAFSKSDFEECIYCNSHNNQDCVRNPLSTAHKTRKCDGGCMTALYPAYNSDNSTFELIRTCLNDKELRGQQTCVKGKDKKCNACSGSKCNTNNIPENRLSCFACDGESCVEPEAKLCPLHRENDMCFVRFDDTNSVSEMGCISSFGNQNLESIVKTKRVQVCSGANCNSLSQVPALQSCSVCNSTDNVSCAVEPTAIGTFSKCNLLPYTSCFTRLTKAGTTERGCVADLPAGDFAACVLGKDNNCSICNGDGCNREIFPLNRQQCFTCQTSEEDKSCDSFPKTKKACPIVRDSESCVTALSGNITVRGCKSLVFCDANDSHTCRSCFGSECNSIDLLNKKDDGYHGVWQELPLKCHTCEGDHCLYSLGPSATCSSRNIYQDCMTVFDEWGKVERRGCSDDVEDYRDLYCRKHPERCFKCKSNECNIAWSMNDYIDCLFCDSSNERLCVVSPDHTGLRSRKCYKKCMVALKEQNVMRSCLDDKEKWVQHQCQRNDTKECSTCSDNNCNKYNFPSDRLKCHVCTDPSCKNSVSQYCEKYDSNDSCFAKYENASVSLMGCVSSQSANDIAEWTAQNKLYKCDSNDCNDLISLPKAKCLSCDSSKNPDCAQNPSDVGTTESCAVLVDKCFTQIDAAGHTIRGCFAKLNTSEQSCESSATCSICQGEKCNDQIHPSNRRKCHICNSAADGNCMQNPSSIKVCPIYKANDSCVSALNSDKYLERGCLSQVKCSIDGNDYCNICSTDGCNTVELKGSGHIVSNNMLLTLLLTLFSAFVLNVN